MSGLARSQYFAMRAEGTCELDHDMYHSRLLGSGTGVRDDLHREEGRVRKHVTAAIEQRYKRRRDCPHGLLKRQHL